MLIHHELKLSGVSGDIAKNINKIKNLKFPFILTERQKI